MEDPYVTLGVPRDAAPEAIRSAYRKLAKQHHPDLNPGNAKAEEKFKSISAANALLSDPEKRAKFDRGEIDASGQEQAPPSYRQHAEGEPGRRYSRADAAQGWGEGDFDDIFGSVFRERRQAGEKMRARGADELYSLTLGFLDAVNGVSQRLTHPDGRTLEVTIPPGIVEGQVLRLRGQGGAGYNDGPPGDALIELHVGEHPFYRRDGQDIRMDLPVTLTEAVIGGFVEVPTPRGAVQMRIPERSDTGKELRLRGRGVPAHDGLPAGDLYARLSVVIGTADSALQEFLKDWKPEPAPDPRRDMKERS